jgi:broad specificity phosphatase PhoE
MERLPFRSAARTIGARAGRRGAKRAVWSTGAVILLVRHGRTTYNAAGQLLGHLDPPLDDVGVTQAAALGVALDGIDLVVSSPLLRARETAEHLGAPVEIDDRWIEVDYGEYDGVTLGTSRGLELWERWRADPAYVPPGGESLEHMGERVAAALVDLVPRAIDRDIAVVSHVSPIKAAVSWVLGAGADAAWRTHLDQASVTRIGVSGRGPILRSFNETWHLVATR